MTKRTYVQIKYDNMNQEPKKPYLLRIAPWLAAMFAAFIIGYTGIRTAYNYTYHQLNSDPMEVLD